MKYAIQLPGKRRAVLVVDSRSLPSLRRQFGNIDKMPIEHESYYVGGMRFYKVTFLHKGGHSVREATTLREAVLCDRYAMKRLKHRTEFFLRERNKKSALKEARTRVALRVGRESSTL